MNFISKTLINSIVICLFISLQVLAQIDYSEKLKVNPDVTIGELDNGLKYYIKENKKPENRAILWLAVNAGSVLEEDNQQGLAHLAEHMAFNGTKNFKKHEIIDYLESIGMQFGPEINAYTSFDQTVYMLQVPSDSAEMVEKGFDILEDWAFNISFEDEEVDKERGVVIEEWRLGRGAQMRMLDKQLPIIFKDSKYANRLPIGKKEILETFEYETLKNFYNDWYRPGLMAVIAVGDFKKESIQKLIKQHFSNNPAKQNPKERTVYEVPDHKEPLFAIATDPEATRNGVSLYFKHDIEEETNIGDYRKYIITNIYNSMLNLRFQELTKKADPPFLYAYSGTGRIVRSKGVYFIGSGVKENGIERGLEALLTEAERVKQHGFTKTEFERAKVSNLRRMEKALAEKDKTDSRRYASECLNHFLQNEPMPGIENEFEYTKTLLPNISVEEVNKLADKYIRDDNLVITVNIPVKEGVKVPAEEELLAIFKSVDNKKIAEYIDEVSDEPLLAAIPEPVAIVDERQIGEIETTEIKLKNGITVLLKPTDFKNDEIQFKGFSLGGTSLVADENYVSANVATSLINESGLGKFTSVELQKKLTGKIVRVNPFIGSFTEGISGSASTKDVETMFQLIYLYFTSPRIDSTSFQSYLTKMKGYLENRSASPEAAYYDTVNVTMTQYHHRTRPWSTELLDEIDMMQAEKIYKERFADASDFRFVFVGNFKVEDIKPLIQIYLGNLPVLNRIESWKDVGIYPPKGVISKTVYKGMEEKSSVRIVFTGPFEWNKENDFELDSMIDVLNIKLREVLREDKSGTYGVRVGGGGGKIPREEYRINISWGCDPARVDELTEAVMEQIDSLKLEPPKEIYVTKVRETQLREYETDLKENRYWLNSFYKSYYYNRELTDILSYPDLYNTLTAEMIQKAAQKYFNMDNYVKVVLKPEAAKDEIN
ncbi:MAG: insulinase family protein [Chlorobi bacterium]|nr:insulinase family protein [Chlorobiota bacterium]